MCLYSTAKTYASSRKVDIVGRRGNTVSVNFPTFWQYGHHAAVSLKKTTLGSPSVPKSLTFASVSGGPAPSAQSLREDESNSGSIVSWTGSIFSKYPNVYRNSTNTRSVLVAVEGKRIFASIHPTTGTFKISPAMYGRNMQVTETRILALLHVDQPDSRYFSV